jgi:predicted nucleic acid-binding protein
MPPPEVILIDTSAFYALVSARDEFHERAVSTFEYLIDREQKLITTSYALVETVALIQRRLGFSTLKGLLDSMKALLETYWVGVDLHTAAWNEVEKSGGIGPSLVDWTIILSAKRLGGQVFAFDSDFAAQNLTVIPR